MTKRYRYSLLLTICTFLLLFAGAGVTSTKSSMAVPDWPLSFGQWMPPMTGGVAYEHGHRMIGALVGVIILGLAGWSWMREENITVRVLAWTALVGVLIQGGLGGITVLWGTANQLDDTHPWFSSIHAVLALILFGIVIAYTAALAPGWTNQENTSGTANQAQRLLGASWVLVLLVYIQIALGAVMRQHNAGLFIPDFPLSLGKIIPDIQHWLVGVSFAHRVMAYAVAAYSLVLAWKTIKMFPLLGWLKHPAWCLAAMVLIQFTLGVWTVLSQLHPLAATLHHTGGALVLLFALLLALRLGRLSGKLNYESKEKASA